MTKPNFFIVGMARGGTTSLWKYLRQHPEIYMSEEKEPNYFDRDILDDIHFQAECEKRGIDKPSGEKLKYKNIENYLSLFKKAKKEKVIGEASVGYISSQTAQQEIYKFNPDAKILISLRNPREAIYSQYHLYKNIGIYLGNFNSFSKLSALIDSYKRMPQNIRMFQKLFGVKNVKIIFFEDLNKNISQIYKDILSFLEVDSCFSPEFIVHNSSKKIKKQKLIHKLFDNRLLLYVRKLFFTSTLDISDRINNLLGGFNKRPIIDIDTKKRLTQEFTSMVKELEEITERDLSHWYFDKDKSVEEQHD